MEFYFIFLCGQVDIRVAPGSHATEAAGTLSLSFCVSWGFSAMWMGLWKITRLMIRSYDSQQFTIQFIGRHSIQLACKGFRHLLKIISPTYFNLLLIEKMKSVLPFILVIDSSTQTLDVLKHPLDCRTLTCCSKYVT